MGEARADTPDDCPISLEDGRVVPLKKALRIRRRRAFWGGFLDGLAIPVSCLGMLRRSVRGRSEYELALWVYTAMILMAGVLIGSAF